MFEVSGVNEESDIYDEIKASNNKTKTSKLNAETGTLLDQNKILVENGQVEVVASIYEFNSTLTDTIETKNQGIRASNKKSKKPLVQGVKYRVLLFDENDKFLTAIDGSSGGTPPVYNGAFRNTKYKWKAYSFNNSNNILPAIPANPTTANFNINSTNTGGLLFASGEVITSDKVNDNNKVNILFKRQTAIVDIVYSGRGMFDKITSLLGNINLPIYNSGVFNLLTGKYVSYTTPINSHVTNLNQTVSSKGDTIRTHTLYTVNDVQSISNYGVNLTSLTFPTDLNSQLGSRTFSSNLNFNFTKSFKPQLGKRYKIIIDFLTTSRNVTNTGGNVDWAYHNLFYNDLSKVYGFRHYNSNFYEKGISAGGQNSGEYFNWKALKPGFAQPFNVVDPCALVYPAGRWKMPAASEFNTLINIPSNISGTPRKSNAGSPDPVRYVNIVLGTGNFAPYDMFTNGLPLLMLGFRENGSNTISGYNTSSTGTSNLYFWSSTEVDSGNSTYFAISNTSSSGTTMNVRTANAAKTYGMNIRCVRNKNYIYKPNIQ
ncbi:hypothetical protein [Sphingobacterium lactis]|uniref:hypothetical protein n=1 Tax=Sphingobacterium lactis TaxID=797291 RepID=UPI003DA25703